MVAKRCFGWACRSGFFKNKCKWILFTDMAREAGTAALKDAGISYQDVEAVVASYCYGEPTSGQLTTGTCSFALIYSLISQDRHIFTSLVT